MGEAQQVLGEFNKRHEDDLTKYQINSGAMSSKATQLAKLRVTPFVVKDFSGKIVDKIFKKSYAEGVDPLSFLWGW